MKGVIGLCNLLLDSELTAEQREHAEYIQVSAQILLTIVNDILDSSRIEAGQLQIEEVSFSLDSLVNNLCKVLSYTARQKQIALVYTLDHPHDLRLVGDPGRIRQVLSNLLR